MALRDPQNAPYQLSRAALRNAYGTRRIDASAPQSAKDSTPSGRQRYLQGKGATDLEAQDQVQQEFKANFPLQIEQPRMLSRAMIQQPIQNPIAQEPLPFNQGGLASPEDIGRIRSRGAASGSFQTPYGPVSFGLLPQTQPAEDMSEFIPSTTGPLSNFSLPKTQAFKRTSGIYG